MSNFKFKMGDTVIFRTCSSVREKSDSYVDNDGEEVYREINLTENPDFTLCHGVWKIGTYAAQIHSNHLVVYHDTNSETIYEIFVREDAILPFNELSKEFTMNLLNRSDEDYTINAYKRKVKNLLVQSSIDLDIDW